MLLSKVVTRAVALGFGVAALLTACSPSGDPLTPKEARSLAMQRIEQEQSFWCYDAELLPPLRMEESSNQYVFTVNDPKQNVSITVVVFKNGEVEDSAVDLNLEKAWKNGQKVILERTKTHCAEQHNPERGQ